MNPNLFVGREEQLVQLNALLKQAASGEGNIVLIEGEAGMGKTEFLDAFQNETNQNKNFHKARFVQGYCYEDIGTQNAFQPLSEILATLVKPDKKGASLTHLILTIVKETGPDWLNMIPGVGPAITAGIKTAVLAGEWFTKTTETQQASQASVISQYTSAIFKIASNYQPLILIIEDAHWIDEASCLLLTRVAKQMEKQPLMVVLTYRPSYLNDTHPLRKLQAELFSRSNVCTIPLKGLNPAQLQDYIQARFQNAINRNLAAWLGHLCDGNPLFVSQYLTLLEQNQIIKLVNNTFILDGKMDYVGGEWALSSNIPIPASIEAVLEQRIQRLIEDDRKLLQNASIQGENFLSTILSEILKIDELDLLPRLRSIVQQHRLIRYGSDADQGDEYTFEHALLHRVFYQKLSPRERVLYHRRIAEILERTVKETPSRKLYIELGRHFKLGGQARQAIQYYYLASQSTYANSAIKETLELCQFALEIFQANPELKNTEGLLYVRVALLYLSAAEMRLLTTAQEEGILDPEILVENAIHVAAGLDDRTLLPQLIFMKGKIHLATKRLQDALAAMNEALEIARKAEDRLGEFAILVHLGNLTKASDFDEGMSQSYEAYRIYKEYLEPKQEEYKSQGLALQFHNLQCFIGIGEFDRGNFGEAIKWLTLSYEGVKKLQMRDMLLRVQNHLGQTYTTIGQFDKAEAILKESLLPEGNDISDPHPWAAYNAAYLGKTYIEWGRIDDASQIILKGWAETQQAWNVSLGRLVRIIFIELLMHPSYIKRDLAEARRQLEIELDESRSIGFDDMVAASLSYLGKLESIQGNEKLALEYSNQAVELLEQKGMKLVAFRAEEILYNHFLLLSKAEQHEDARAYLEKARNLVKQKAETLTDEAQRQIFLENVPLSKAIMGS